MPTTRKTPAKTAAKASPKSSSPSSPEGVASAFSTVGAPSTSALTADDAVGTVQQQRLVIKAVGTQALAQAMPANPLKAGEFGRDNAVAPPAGQPLAPNDPIVGSSSVTEDTSTGSDAIERQRVDATGQVMRTNQGVAISDNQNSLKAGLRGHTALEDFILREKITHFDHERIPERIVHARGSGAHGYFECYDALTDLTMAAPFQAAGKRTPVFVRFSTVAGGGGSADTARDVRGFAVKFYTDAGNWDLVGNNIPVFFIQDAMKFPDLIHAVKPEPHHGMPQAASAHDTFWDFASLMPETAHMLLWVMSDRAIPRSYRMMQGFGVHTFRLVNEQGESVFVKFHWTPVAGTHSLVWDEAVKISGADADFHRRDLWEAIEGGNFPEWELGFQTFTEAQADAFNFDVLDATKLVPEELAPIKPVGRMVLNRNPDNFFAETEQVAFCTAHIVPGIDFSNDPLLQGRIHSYVDTQLSRLGGPNFHEIPINSPVIPAHNNQRDGMHRQAIHRGRVSYEPNSLGGGCPFQAGSKGFVSFPQPLEGDKVRGKAERFADHYSQATMFWNSQTPTEKNHIIGAFRFELTRVQTQAVRERVISVLANVADELATGVATGLGIEVPAAQVRALEPAIVSAVEASPTLSMTAYPGDGAVTGLRVALLVGEGIESDSLRAAYKALMDAGAAPRFVGARLGAVAPRTGDTLHVEVSLEAAPSVLWDAVVLPDDSSATRPLALAPQAVDFVKDQFRHCKPLLALGGATALLEAAGVQQMLPNGEADPGLFVGERHAEPAAASDSETIAAFIAGLGKQRHYERETDPPRV